MLERGVERARYSDERLVHALADDDADALGVLWDRHARPAYSLALRMLRDRGGRRKSSRTCSSGCGPIRRCTTPRGDLRRWLLTVTHHAAVDGLRSKRGTAVARDAGPEGLEFVSQRGEDPADSAWRNLQAESVRAAILDLPSAQREAMELIYFHGLTQAETAERTG
jgi:RNA polymerase sigma-70 factor, ECF subfamily